MKTQNCKISFFKVKLIGWSWAMKNVSQTVSGGMSWHSIKLQNNLLMEGAGSIISPIHLEQDNEWSNALSGHRAPQALDEILSYWHFSWACGTGVVVCISPMPHMPIILPFGKEEAGMHGDRAGGLANARFALCRTTEQPWGALPRVWQTWSISLSPGSCKA